MPTGSHRDDSFAQRKEPIFPLRSFAEEDFQKLFELDQLCFRPGIAYSQEDLQAFIHHPSAVTIVAEDRQRQIAGFAILELYREKHEIIAHVVTLDVHPSLRRLGLGRQLMLVLDQIAKGNRAWVLRLEVSAEDVGAQAFYRNMGFLVVRTLKRYYLNKIDALLMERSLKPELES